MKNKPMPMNDMLKAPARKSGSPLSDEALDKVAGGGLVVSINPEDNPPTEEMLDYEVISLQDFNSPLCPKCGSFGGRQNVAIDATYLYIKCGNCSAGFKLSLIGI